MAERRPALRPIDFDPFRAEARAAEEFALTEPQKEMWSAAAMEDAANCSYNQTFVFTLEGPLRVDSLRTALDQLVARHAALRVSIASDGMRQTIRPAFSLSVPLVDLTEADAASREQEIDRLITCEGETPFDLAQGPLVRASVIRESPVRHHFILTAHHIVCDGWSSAVLFSDLGRLYAADCSGIPAHLAPAASYAQYLAEQTGPGYSALAAADEDYWAGQFADGAPVLDLPLEGTRPAAKTYRADRAELRIDNDLYTGIKKAGAKSGATLFATLLAAFEVLLHRLSGQTDFVVGIPFAGQLLLDNPALVAHCVNTVPLRARLEPADSFSSILVGVRRQLAEAQDHARLTFGSLVRRLRVPRDRSRTPLVALTFNIDKVGTPFDFGDVTIASVKTPKSTINFELSVNVVDNGSNMLVECDYNADLFGVVTMKRWLAHYETLLRSIVANREEAAASLAILGDEQKRQVLVEWNDTRAAFPEEKRLHRLFEAQVRRGPDGPALVDGDDRLTYRELNDRANRLAHRLRSMGVGPEKAVGVCLERSADLIVALMAVLKAGGFYVPLDPAYPKDRVAFMLQDSQAKALITQSGLSSQVGAYDVERILLDQEAASIAARPSGDLDDGSEVSNLAYVIYTSGSTGVPKGVAIEHRSAGTLVHWARSVFTDKEISGVLASTSVCFDLSVFEIFFPLAWGGRIIIAANALELASLPARDEVFLVNTVPSAAAELVRADAFPPSVETVCLAGEPLATRLVDQLYATGHVKRVLDLYGPSEDTTYSTWALRRGGAPPTIGQPIANTQAYILDARRQPVPPGVVGELYLAGDGLARGYLHREALTEERFVQLSFDGVESRRAYRTGDLARHRSDGTIDFLGRTDHQVKIRGFRIELGEVEAALGRHEAVKDAVVVAREDRPGDKRLVAYVAVRSDSENLAYALKAHLRQALPEYMVPAHVVFLPSLPLTPNGKVDRKALPVPDPETAAAGVAHVPPSTATEARIAAIWADVLATVAPGIHDNFFDVGGHSLNAVQIVTKLRSAFGVGVAMRHLFERPTVAGLAQLVDLFGVASAPAARGGGAGREEIEI